MAALVSFRFGTSTVAIPDEVRAKPAPRSSGRVAISWWDNRFGELTEPGAAVARLPVLGGGMVPHRSQMTRRKGFTLLELLIVVVIIGILAAIAIPKFSTSKEKAVIVTMKSDLRNLVVSQEAYLADTQTYYNGPLPAAALSYNPSPGVTIMLSNVTVVGWAATATAVGTTWTCGVFVGSSGPAGPATIEGLVACAP